jgi:hypothetical protein
MEQFAAFIALDWSDEKHDVALFDPSTGKGEAYTIKHSAQSINEWATESRQRFAGQKVAVCLEQSRGPLIYAFLKYDFFVLYPINPKTLARYREAFSPSGAKDDPTDTDYLLDILIHHRERLKAWRPDDEKTRTLQYMVEHRRKLVNDRTRVSNRMSALLKLYFRRFLNGLTTSRQWLPVTFCCAGRRLMRLSGQRRRHLRSSFRSITLSAVRLTSGGSERSKRPLP